MPKRPKEDPALPETFLVALDTLWAQHRESGVLVGGLAGPPIFLSQLRRALEARFGLTGARLDDAQALVSRAVSAQLAGPWRREGPGWVDSWRPPGIMVYR